MHLTTPLLVVGAAALAAALPSNKDKRYFDPATNYTVFEHEATGATLSYVTNSGICETTPGVNQYSGYLTVGTGMNMFFWFFEARNAPTTAPLAMWLNGGPGCSSMIGLFQENGPCQFYDGASTPSVNPYSFNTYANMLYVDQPIGTGFSYGTDDATSTVTAAPYVWQLLQAFYAAFPDYESRNFGLFTESYGGHYGPEFAYYFEEQNSAIAAGTATGDTINLKALGINNGWYNPITQYKAYIEYAYNNTYEKLITLSQYTSYMSSYTSKCLPLMDECTSATGSNSACLDADDECYDVAEYPIEASGDFDVYDIREPSDDPYPPETYVTYLQQSSVQTAIGAKQKYSECPDAPYEKIVATGDEARPFLSQLSDVVQSGVTVLLWAGDADWICNWIGGYEVANLVTYSGTSTFAAKGLTSYTVNGTAYGEYKTVDNLSFLKVYEAGHEVPYYQPKVALQAFWQTLQGLPLTST